MKLEDIKKVACFASGTIGASWAVYYAFKGYPCAVYIPKEDSPQRVRAAIDSNINSFIVNEVISKEKAADIRDLILLTTDLTKALGDAQFIQENGPESYEIKQKIMEIIDNNAPSTAIVASSTSGLKISEIAKRSKYPERCIGAHPFNPPHLIPLVEITKGKKTSESTVTIAVAFYKKIGKEPVVLKKEVLGFIANRIAHALYREAVSLVSEGVCTVEDIDKAVVYGPGLRWAILGPNMIYELGAGDAGIKGTLSKFNSMSNLLFSDLSNIKAYPENYEDLAQAGVDIEKANFPKNIGNTNEEIATFRDKVLIELLKLHNKF